MMKRLKYGSSKYMMKEDLKKHKCLLQKEWRAKHPDIIKAQNRYYANLYAETKPFVCVCIKCGRKFNAARNSYKKCPWCIEKKKKLKDMRLKVAEIKRKERKAEYQKILEMHKKGIKQQAIADALGRCQSGVSAIIRKLNTCKK